MNNKSLIIFFTLFIVSVCFADDDFDREILNNAKSSALSEKELMLSHIDTNLENEQLAVTNFSFYMPSREIVEELTISEDNIIYFGNKQKLEDYYEFDILN